MKELSIEEKATRYDEAVRIAKSMYQSNETEIGVKDYLYVIFPELKESENERIRGAIIDHLKDNNLNGWAAWLEKQGGTFTKKDVDDAYLKGVCDAKHELEKQGKNNMGISEATKKQLEDNLNKALEKETPESWNEFLEKQGEQKPAENKGTNLAEEDMTPFQKKVFCIIDTTIEEEQGLKQVCDELLALASNEIKQNLAWSEEEELYIRELEGIVKQKWAIAEHENDKDTIHKMSDLSFFLKTLKPQSKQEWSEDDRRIFDNINLYIRKAGDYPHFGKENIKEAINWMNALKDRVQPQNRLKESLVTANLENSLCDIQDGFSDTSYEYRTLGEAIEFIRCAESKPQWKPSDEQMKVLNEVLNFAANHESPHWNDYIFGTLNNLIRQLKKL